MDKSKQLHKKQKTVCYRARIFEWEFLDFAMIIFIQKTVDMYLRVLENSDSALFSHVKAYLFL